MKVKSIAECFILQYFWPALSDNWSWKPCFGLFESGHFRQVYFNLKEKISRRQESNHYPACILFSFSGIRHPEEMSIMKKFDKDDLKKNIKENLNPKNKKKKESREELNVTNGQNGLHHSSNNSLDRLSPYSRSPMNRSPMGPSPSVSIQCMEFARPQGYKKCSCSIQLSTKFQLLIKTKIPTNKEVSCFKPLKRCIYHADKW